MINIFEALKKVEPENPTKAIEVEYCYFIKMSAEQLSNFWETYHDADQETITEIGLMYNHETGVKGRIRKYNTSKLAEPIYELTTKAPSDVKKGKIEVNNAIDKLNYEMLAQIGSNRSVRTRVSIPLRRPSDNSIVMNGDVPLQWEVDFYVDASSTQSFTNGEIHPWIKIELEVKTATLDDVINLIPFDYIDIIKNDSASEQDRALIGSLYAEYQLVVGVTK